MGAFCAEVAGTDGGEAAPEELVPSLYKAIIALRSEIDENE